MMRSILAGLLLLMAGGSASAQQEPAAQPGQRLFVQHCGVCHLRLQINGPPSFGPSLSKASFANGRDAELKSFISDGTPNMPGFKYLFSAQQIDSVVEYLKTVEPTTPAATKK